MKPLSTIYVSKDILPEYVESVKYLYQYSSDQIPVHLTAPVSMEEEDNEDEYTHYSYEWSFTTEDTIDLDIISLMNLENYLLDVENEEHDNLDYLNYFEESAFKNCSTLEQKATRIRKISTTFWDDDAVSGDAILRFKGGEGTATITCVRTEVGNPENTEIFTWTIVVY